MGKIAEALGCETMIRPKGGQNIRLMEEKSETGSSTTPSVGGDVLPIENMILEVRGKQVMLDRDLAWLYGVETKRHNAQYAPISVQAFSLSHDRFLCIDDEVYHIGASIKDLGKRWFAFSLLEDVNPMDLVDRINGK